MTALKAPCPHGRYEPHRDNPAFSTEVCPGGTLLPPDSLVIVKEDGEWPEWTEIAGAGNSMMLGLLDALAAAQPGKVTEEARAELDAYYRGGNDD